MDREALQMTRGPNGSDMVHLDILAQLISPPMDIDFITFTLYIFSNSKHLDWSFLLYFKTM